MENEYMNEDFIIVPEDQTVYGNNLIVRELSCSPNAVHFTFSCNDNVLETSAENAYNLLILCQASPVFIFSSNFNDERTVHESYLVGLAKLLNNRFWNICRSVTLNGPFTDNILMTLPINFHHQMQVFNIRNITTSALKLSNVLKRHLNNLTSLSIDARRMQIDSMESIIYQIVATKITNLKHIWINVNDFTDDLDTVVHLLSAITAAVTEIYIFSEAASNNQTNNLLTAYGFIKQNDIENYPAAGSEVVHHYETWTYQTAERRFVFAFQQHD